MSNIVITGAGGFIGSNLAKKLHNKGHNLVLIDNFKYGYESNIPLELLPSVCELDIRDGQIFDIFQDADYVFHFAGISALPVNQTNPYESVSVNVAGTANVLEAARRGGVKRVIFASTSAIYENNKATPFSEYDTVRPDLLYSLTKKLSEELLDSFYRLYKLPYICLRFFNVYGPNHDWRRKSPPMIAYIIRELLHNRQPILHSDGQQRRDYVYIDDVVSACQNAIGYDLDNRDTFNICSGKTYSVTYIYDTIAEILQTDLKPIFRKPEAFWDTYPELFQGFYPLCRKRIIDEVNKYSHGYEKHSEFNLRWIAKTSLEEGLEKTIEDAKKVLL